MAGTLSVIMANYNHGHYLNQSVTAVLGQSYPPTQFIIVDDASTDDSFERLEQFAKSHPSIKLLRNAKNMGPVESFQKALVYATGSYVYGAAADDMVLPGFFEKCIPVLDAHPEAGLVHTDFQTMDGRVNNFFPLKEPRYFSSGMLIRLLKRSGYFAGGGPNSIFRRTALIEVGGFRPELKWHCDSFALILIGLRYGACYVPGSYVAIRVALDSYSRGGSLIERDEREILERILELLNTSAFDDIRPLLSQALVWPVTAPQSLSLIFKDERFKSYRSLRLVTSALKLKLRREIVHFVPLGFKRWYWQARNQARKLRYSILGRI